LGGRAGLPDLAEATQVAGTLETLKVA
jgi:hypothetical protein